MAVVFPPNPTVGQTVTDPTTGAVWMWNGTAWVPQASGGGAFLPLSGGTITGNLKVNGLSSVQPANSIIQFPPTGAVAGQFMAGNVIAGGTLCLNTYNDGTNWHQLPGTGSTSGSADIGGAAFQSQSSGIFVYWAPPAADTVQITLSQLAFFGPHQTNLLGPCFLNNTVVGAGAFTIAGMPGDDAQISLVAQGVRTYLLGAQNATGDFYIFDQSSARYDFTSDVYGNINMPGQVGNGWCIPAQGNNAGYCGSPAQAWADMNSYAFTTVSDPRDKRDMAPAPAGALEKVKALSVINYRLIEPPEKEPPAPPLAAAPPDGTGAMSPPRRKPDYDKLRTGFDATEVHKVHPDAVTMDDEGINPRGYSLGDLNALLWQAVQELTAKVEALEAKAVA